MTLGAYRENQLVALPVKPQPGDVRIIYYRGRYRVEVWCWRFLWLGRHWMKTSSYENYNEALTEAKGQMDFRNKNTEVLWINGVGKDFEEEPEEDFDD